jgi:hypothetical protein
VQQHREERIVARHADVRRQQRLQEVADERRTDDAGKGAARHAQHADLHLMHVAHENRAHDAAE